VPDFVSEMNNWIFLIGGVLILIGGASILMHRKKGKVFGFPQ
jgi:LPXTG-motif cell wall-anchored protein